MKKTRVLAIDDNTFFLTMLKKNLESMGCYEVKTAEDGREALPKARMFHPDVIVLDLVMPEVDGGEVMARLNADPELKKIPVICVTAVMDEQLMERTAGYISGHTFLPKPVTVGRLVSCINEHIEH